MERGAVEVAGAVKKPTSFAGGLFCFLSVTLYSQSCFVSIITVVGEKSVLLQGDVISQERAQ